MNAMRVIQIMNIFIVQAAYQLLQRYEGEPRKIHFSCR